MILRLQTPSIPIIPDEWPNRYFQSCYKSQCKATLCASHEYVSKFGNPTHPEQLSQHICIRRGENPKDSIWEFEKDNQRAAVSVNGCLIVNHSEIRREAVLNGIGLSIFPDFTITPYIKCNKVVEVLPD